MLKKWMLVTGCAAGLLLALQLPQVLAQDRSEGRNGPPPRRDPNKRQLGALWHGMLSVEGSKTPLSKAQARQIVAIVRPWSSKNSMTDAQAKTLMASLNGVLTAAQKNVVGDVNEGPGDGPPGIDGPPHGRRRGDGPPHGRRGDGPPPDGRRGDGPPRMDDKMMKMLATLNPFYAPTGYSNFKTLPARMQTQLLRHYQENRATLIMLSHKAG